MDPDGRIDGYGTSDDTVDSPTTSMQSSRAYEHQTSTAGQWTRTDGRTYVPYATTDGIINLPAAASAQVRPQLPQTQQQSTSTARPGRRFPETERPFLAFVRTTADALAIINGARNGIIPAVNRRLSPAERGALIQSGATFVFDERTTGIKRWTDGRNWSPSRILGNFLIYRELVRDDGSSDDYEYADNPELQATDRELVRDVFGSHRDHTQYRRGGFMKRTLSLMLEGTTTHLINYYLPQDALQGRLPQPTQSGPLVDLGQSSRLAQIAHDQLRRPTKQRGSDGGLSEGGG